MNRRLRFQFVLASVLQVALGVAVDGATVIEHQGDRDPQTEGWTLNAAPGAAELATAGPVRPAGAEEPAAWQVAKSAAGGNSYFCYHADTAYDANAAAAAERHGFRVTARVRVVAATGLHAQSVEVGTTRRRYVITFDRDSAGSPVVHFYGGRPATVSLGGLDSGYHTYVLTSAPGSDDAFLTVDDKPVGGPYRGIPAGEYGGRFIFGNNASEAAGTADYHVVRLETAPQVDSWPSWESADGVAGYVRTSNGRFPEPVVAVDNVCAWPNLTQLPTGEIVATIFNQPSHGGLEGDVECWSSSDGGKSWDKVGTPAVHEPNTNRMNVAAGLAGNGDLIVLASGWQGKDVGGPFQPHHPVKPWICRSSDGGRNWSVDKMTLPERTPANTPVVPFGDIVAGPEGELRAIMYGQRGDVHQSFVYRSRDDGRTWVDPVPIDTETQRNEAALFHVSKGQWIVAARTDHHGGGLYLYESSDNAKSWQFRQRITGDAQHPGHLMRLRSGDLLLSYGNRTSGNKGVDVRISDDQGQTWSEPKRVVDFEGDGGYPSSVQRSDGRVVTAYYASHIAGHDRYHMGVVAWDPERTFQRATLEQDSGIPVTARTIDVRKIWDVAPHNAFTDLIRWKNEFYCAFREGRGHASTDGRIRLLVSDDGTAWQSTASVSMDGFDLRDADLSATPDGRLMLLGGVAPREKDGTSAPTGTFVCFSEDGRTWTTPQIVVQPGRWLWRATWHAGRAYGFTYPAGDGQGIDLLVSSDGIDWTIHAENLVTADAPTEVQVCFDATNRAYALVRRDRGTALLGKSSGDFREWRWYDLDRSLVWGKPYHGGTEFRSFGGPNLIETLPGHWIGGGRMRDGGPHMALTYVDVEAGSMARLARLPSGGDCSYPGLAWHDDTLYVSYYASHEGKTSIYLARLRVTPRRATSLPVCKDAGAGSYEAFPDLARLHDGRLICVFYAGYGHVSLPREDWPLGGRICFVLSSDEGQTWTAPQVLYDGPGDERDPSITQLREGGLICTFFRAGSAEVWMTRSDDGAETWSTPRKIVSGYYVSAPIRELPSGRLLLGLYAQGSDTAHGAVIASDDGGKTWRPAIDIDNGGVHLDAETDLVALKDGRVYAIQRGGRGATMHWSISHDQGETWTKSASVGFPGHAPYLHRTRDGVVVLAYRGPNQGVQTWGTKLRYSVDECETWSEEFTVDAWANGAYPSLVELADGSTLIVYYDDKGVGRKGGYRSVSDIRSRRLRVGRDGLQFQH